MVGKVGREHYAVLDYQSAINNNSKSARLSSSQLGIYPKVVGFKQYIPKWENDVLYPLPF